MLEDRCDQAAVEFSTKAHKHSSFLWLNPRGQAPVLEWGLRNNPWLPRGRPTIADVACYPFSAAAPDGGFNLEDFLAVAAWLKHLEAPPGRIKRA